jgi:4-amino-4-deoxychorismate lyase
MNRTRRELFHSSDEINLSNIIKIPDALSSALYKCRVIYTNTIHDIEFHAYRIKPVNALKVVYDDSIEYEYKFEDRRDLLKHIDKEGTAEILIVKNGLITDTSYANIVLSDEIKFITPSRPLLKGTKREKLLGEGGIIEHEIKLSDLNTFKYAYLINAMIDLEDKIRIPIKDILF